MTPELVREAWDRFNATVRNKVAGEYGPFTNQHWADICAIWQAHADALEKLKVAEEALRGVIRVADRATVEFDKARAALAAIRGK